MDLCRAKSDFHHSIFFQRFWGGHLSNIFPPHIFFIVRCVFTIYQTNIIHPQSSKEWISSKYFFIKYQIERQNCFYVIKTYQIIAKLIYLRSYHRVTIEGTSLKYQIVRQKSCYVIKTYQTILQLIYLRSYHRVSLERTFLRRET